MKLVLVGGFLGAGKTTLLWQSARRLSERGLSVGLITNDQVPGLVDTAFLSCSGLEVREVAGSCFCCNFDGFVEAIQSLADGGADCILAEPVGSCTDLSATIVQPLKAFHPQWQLAPLSVLVDPARIRDVKQERNPLMHADAAYILHLQMEEADQILLNKVDELSDSERVALEACLQEEFPRTSIGNISALSGQGIDDWLDGILRSVHAGTRIASVDYDRYANGEAVLGWLNAVVGLTWSGDVQPDWQVYAHQLLLTLQEGLRKSQSEVGHIKLLIDSPQGRVMANLTGLNARISVRVDKSVTNPATILTVNARAQATPGTIENLFRKTIAKVLVPPVLTTIKAFYCIQPGRPQPTHRYEGVIS